MRLRNLRGSVPGRVAVAGALLAVLVVAGWTSASSTAGRDAAVGQPPPEWAANADGWPAHNYDLSNTRATKRSAISSETVSTLAPKWRFPFKSVSAFGAFASTPIVLGDRVYLQDLDSNVYAISRSTGKLVWRHMFNAPSIGPNGVAYGYGRLYGATETTTFALDPKTGEMLWQSRRLPRNNQEGIDMAPQVYDNTVLVSTIPGNTTSFYKGNGDGMVWALDAATGKPKWSFNTVSDGGKLWGNPKLNSGGGLWYPPAVDSHGRVFLSVANPAPLYGTKQFPNGSSRPGPNLYTDSLVALNGKTGKLLWYRQPLAHDLRDYDLMIPAIVANLRVNGVKTEVVMVAGKMGKAYAYRAGDGKPLWTLSVGRHQNDTGPLPRKNVTIYPGDFGGVETPMAYADGRLFIPWVDFPAVASATGLSGGFASNFNAGRGGLAAVDATTGKVLWQHKFPSIDVGAATVANDIVFTSTYDGTIYGFDTKTGKTVWTKKAPAGINSFPAIDRDTLLIGAGAPGLSKNPVFGLVAYRLGSGSGTTPPPSKNATVQVQGGEYFFKLSTKSLAQPGTATFVFKNVGHTVHDFSIGGKTTPLLQPGTTARLTVTFTKAGSYEYLCTVGGHAQLGMKGTFTVH